MRRIATAIGLAVLMAAVVGLVARSASAAGSKKLVEGTVYDTTCAAACLPECPPPPCGPVTQSSKGTNVCVQQRRLVVCPLHGGSPRVCLPSSNCGGYPVYSGKGAIVNVRKRGSATVITSLPVIEGRFKVRLGAGEYVFHPYLAEEPCWSGRPATQEVTPRLQSPVPVAIDVANTCVAHLGSGGK